MKVYPMFEHELIAEVASSFADANNARLESLCGCVGIVVYKKLDLSVNIALNTGLPCGLARRCVKYC